MQEWVAGESREGTLGRYEVLMADGKNYGLVAFHGAQETSFLKFAFRGEPANLENVERGHESACVEAASRVLAEERADDFTAYVRSLPEDLRYFTLDEEDEYEAARLRESIRDALFVGVRWGNGDPYRMAVYFEKNLYGVSPDERIVEMMRSLPRDVLTEAQERGLVDGCSREIEAAIGERSQTVRNATASCRAWFERNTEPSNGGLRAPRP